MKLQMNPLALTSCSVTCDQTVLTWVPRVSGSRKSVESFYSLTRVNSRVSIEFKGELNGAGFETERGVLRRIIHSVLPSFKHDSAQPNPTSLDESFDRFPTVVGCEYFFGLKRRHGPNPYNQHATFPRCFMEHESHLPALLIGTLMGSTGTLFWWAVVHWAL
jgi:hypothetical protein